MKRIQSYLLILILNLFLAACSNNDDDKVSPGGNNSGITLPAASITALQTEKDLDVLLNQIGESRYVLLGEASHGTAEFYTWRAAITRRLIQEKGFNLIAVEGDWPSAYEVNRYIRGEQNAPNAATVLKSFQRWPTWMWANQEIADLTEWLRQYNQSQTTNKVGFYGLDVYSLWESLEAIAQNSAADPATLAAVKSAQSCLAPYNRNEQAYGQAAVRGSSCAGAINEVLVAVRNQKNSVPSGNEALFNAEQNALVAVHGEQYYQAMMMSSASSWNIRDRHMMETINRLVEHQGSNAKIIVWAHNTHVGDARYTDMAAGGEINVGQLVRQQHAQAGVYVVGFGTYEGSVIASNEWGGPTSQMSVPEAQEGSWENILHQNAPGNKIINLQLLRNEENLNQLRGNRAIGVVYNPARETGNYVPTNFPQRYDSFIFIDKTQALHPL